MSDQLFLRLFRRQILFQTIPNLTSHHPYQILFDDIFKFRYQISLFSAFQFAYYTHSRDIKRAQVTYTNSRKDFKTHLLDPLTRLCQRITDGIKLAAEEEPRRVETSEKY